MSFSDFIGYEHAYCIQYSASSSICHREWQESGVPGPAEEQKEQGSVVSGNLTSSCPCMRTQFVVCLFVCSLLLSVLEMSAERLGMDDVVDMTPLPQRPRRAFGRSPGSPHKRAALTAEEVCTSKETATRAAMVVPSPLLEIDGSMLEGGGQIIRITRCVRVRGAAHE
jgi:hypothetical protein